MILKVNATRMELSKLKKELTIAISGHRLLKDKRDEMMRQFLNMKNDALKLRQSLEKELDSAYMHFAFASAALGHAQFKTALLGEKQKYSLEIGSKSIMNVPLPMYDFSLKNEHLPYPLQDLNEGVEKLSNLAEELIKLAELEFGIKKLAGELEKTRRHVNSLEYVTIPNYQETIHYIRMRIEENARSNTARLIKVKDMIIEEKLTKKTPVAD